MNPHLITPSMAAKEALMALARFSMFGQGARLPQPPVCAAMIGPPGRVFCVANISPHDLAASIEEFSYHFVIPLMADMAHRIPLGVKYADLPLPHFATSGGSGAVETYRDFSMRCIIDEIPVPDTADPRIWRSYKRYYDVTNDELVWGNTGLAIRFDMMPEASQ